MTKLKQTAILKNIKQFFVASIMAFLVMVPSASFADDWIAEQLRGRVFMFDGGDWILMQRGDVISDERYIRSIGGGRVTFVRGNESIEIRNQTQIRIMDADDTKYTTVMQDFGTVAIEAEVEQVQHFSVVTPFLAAVVKGTQFTVSVYDEKAEVRVNRGLVQVRDSQNEIMTNVRPGQRAKVQPGRKIQVSGKGPKEPMTTFEGEVLTEAEVDDAVSKANGNSGNNGNGNGNSGNNGNGNSGNNGNGNGNSGNNGNGNGNSGNNGNGNGNSGNNGNGNGNSGNNGNGNGNSGNNGNGNGNSGNNGNGNGNSGNNGNGNGNSGNNGNGNGNSGNNGNGNGNSGNNGNGN